MYHLGYHDAVKRSIAFAFAGLFLVALFLVGRFPPTLSEVVGLEQSLIYKSGATVQIAYPFPILLGSLLPRSVLYSYQWHRLLPISAGLFALILFPETGWAIIILAISPWFVRAAFFDLNAVLTLILVEAILWLDKNNKNFLLPFFILMLSFTSLAGIVFAGIFVIVLAMRQKIIGALVCGIILFLTFLPFGRYQTIYAQILGSFDNYDFTRATFDVNYRAHDETVINNYQTVIPLAIERISYNKWFFKYLHDSKSIFNSFNFDRIFSPSEEGITVARSLWGETGFMSLFFWEMWLVLLGILSWQTILPKHKKIIVVTSIAGVIATIVTPSANFEQAGILVLISICLLAGHGVNFLVRKPVILVITIFISVVGIISSYYYFFHYELAWRDNRPFVMYNTAALARDYPQQPVVITDIIGPNQFYYAWEKHLDPKEFWSTNTDYPKYANVRFDNFDLTKKLCFKSAIYIGFPGQFIGNGAIGKNNDFFASQLPGNMRLLSAFKFEKHVSYGNGDQIWAVQVN